MNTSKNQFKVLLAVLLLSVTVFSCKKDEHTPPAMEFKTGGSYISTDQTIGQVQPVLFGVEVTKTEDELETFDVSLSLDGGTPTSIQTETITGTEQDGFERDIPSVTLPLAGTEKYIFTVTDRDGNITQKSITLTVQ